LINEDSLWRSPNGRYLVVKTSVKEIPASWNDYEDAVLKLQTRGPHLKGAFTFTYQYELIDTHSGTSEVLMDAPLAHGDSDALWKFDSSAIVLSGTYLPLDVPDPVQRKIRESTKFVVEVTIPSRDIIPITSEEVKVLKWNSEEARLLTREPSGRFKVFENHKTLAAWSEVEVKDAIARNAPPIKLTVEENMNTPPRLFATMVDTGQKALLIDPNPQFAAINFGRVEEVNFKASDGRWVKAGVYRPPDYVSGKKYPLVIQTHGWDPERFWIDGPYSTAYSAMPLASKGFVVLQVDDEDWSKLGSLEEVNEAVAIYEGGISYLDERGLIDRARVGIIGFSRSGLFVQYALTHSNFHFAAATLADISDGGYFRYLALLNLSSGFASDPEGINGGIPFGDGLHSWTKNSPGFSLDRVTAPVRMEADNANSISLLFEWEWFAGLTRLRRPVELVYISDGDHPLVKPWERMISQQGDVDWFCFWLEGEEDLDPAKAEQYVRWRHLRRGSKKEQSRNGVPSHTDIGQQTAGPE
jgi:hypothetical protein